MFDFAWSEIALIGVVALIAIGPKDMPAAIKTVAQMVKKARKMAAEFQTHVDEMVRDADLHEVRDQVTQLRNFDFRGEIERHVDSDGTIKRALNENPLAPSWEPPKPTTEPILPESIASDSIVAEAAIPEAGILEPGAVSPDLLTGDDAPLSVEANRILPEQRTQAHWMPPVPEDDAPSFIPPAAVAKLRARDAAPAFIPPQIAANIGRPPT
jgi:sec-independent protein translocase protein TatB